MDNGRAIFVHQNSGVQFKTTCILVLQILLGLEKSMNSFWKTWFPKACCGQAEGLDSQTGS